jgi:hypothetical protein
MRNLIAALLATFFLTFLACKPASAQLYTGVWYDPNQAGVGFSLEQDGTSAFLIWYAYNANGSATWYYSIMSVTNGQVVTGPATLSGNVSLATASGLKANLAPVSTSVVTVGTAVFQTSSPSTAALQITINGTVNNYNLVRFNIGTVNLVGTYSGVQKVLTSTCPGAAAAGTFIPVTASIAQTNTTITAIAVGGGATCTLNGSYVVAGSQLVITNGTYSCSNGTVSNVSNVNLMPGAFGSLTFGVVASYTTPNVCSGSSIITLQQ